MAKLKFLLAGESWVSHSVHLKGWDFYSAAVYETGVEYLEMALNDTDIEFTHMPSHQAAADFPMDLEGLRKYDVICLSDIGSNTLLLHPDTYVKSFSTPNRLKLLADWVRTGGGLLMCGGYYSFAGIYGGAKYYRSPLEPVLPVSIHTFDDRVESPEGVKPHIVMPDHAIVKGMGTDWPVLLGFNEIVARPEAELIAKVDEHPLLAAMQVGEGRSVAWASDIGPHWCPTDFLDWRGYGKLWSNVVHWLAKK